MKTGGDLDNILELGETWTYTCTTNLALDTTNTVVATGQPADANGIAYANISPVSDQASASVNVINPKINLEKVPSATQVNPGTNVTYTFIVTNPGDDPLAGVNVSDTSAPRSLPRSRPAETWTISLDPGETWTYTCSTWCSTRTR